MNSFGQTFRQLRKNRGLTLKDVASDSISYSNLAAFERGEHIISLDTLVLILEKLNITLQEFNTILDLPIPEYQQILTKITTAAADGNTSQIINEMSKLDITKQATTYCTYLMLKAILGRVDNETMLTKDEISFISEYLWNCDILGHYDLSLFGNTLYVLKTETILTFDNEIFDKITKLSDHKQNTRDYIRTIQNSVIELINRQQYEQSLMILRKMDPYLTETYFFERFTSMFYKNIVEYKLTNNQQFKSNCKKSIALLDQLDVSTYRSYFTELEERFLL